MTEKTAKTQYDWDLIEKEYRTGLKSDRQLSAEFGPSHTAIQKRAKKFGWVKDLSAPIRQAAADKVAKALVASEVAMETKRDDARLVDAVSAKVADIDLETRADISTAFRAQKQLLEELVLLGDPQFVENLEKLGELLDESGPDENGRWKNDKANELYRYIISLAGRVKMAKDISAAYGVYAPMLRKMFGLDGEQQKASEIDELLKRVHAERMAKKAQA